MKIAKEAQNNPKSSQHIKQCITLLALTLTSNEDSKRGPDQPQVESTHQAVLHRHGQTLTFDEAAEGCPNQSHIRSIHQAVALTLTFDEDNERVPQTVTHQVTASSSASLALTLTFSEDNEGSPDQLQVKSRHQTVHLWPGRALTFDKVTEGCPNQLRVRSRHQTVNHWH